MLHVLWALTTQKLLRQISAIALSSMQNMADSIGVAHIINYKYTENKSNPVPVFGFWLGYKLKIHNNNYLLIFFFHLSLFIINFLPGILLDPLLEVPDIVQNALNLLFAGDRLIDPADRLI